MRHTKLGSFHRDNERSSPSGMEDIFNLQEPSGSHLTDITLASREADVRLDRRGSNVPAPSNPSTNSVQGTFPFNQGGTFPFNQGGTFPFVQGGTFPFSNDNALSRMLMKYQPSQAEKNSWSRAHMEPNAPLGIPITSLKTLSGQDSVNQSKKPVASSPESSPRLSSQENDIEVRIYSTFDKKSRSFFVSPESDMDTDINKLERYIKSLPSASNGVDRVNLNVVARQGQAKNSRKVLHRLRRLKNRHAMGRSVKVFLSDEGERVLTSANEL